MMESVFRDQAVRLQKAYDWMPYPAQNMLTCARGWFLSRNRYRRELYTLLGELRIHEKWSTEQIRAYQSRELRRIVEHARCTVPFYANYSPADFHEPEDLSQYPVLSREVIQEHAERLLSRSLGSGERVWVRTTGTTGASLRVAYSPEGAWRNWAFRMRQWTWAGVKLRSPRITLSGSRIVPPARRRPPYWTYNLSERQRLVSIFHLSEQTAADYIAFLFRHRGLVLEGFPSVLGILADFILERRSAIPMQVVFTDGEPLYTFLRGKIERAFQIRVFDAYGNTENCGLIQECDQHHMHLIPDYAYLEILDERDRPVRQNEEGFLVWTGFVNSAMPFIRYRIGDRGCWQPGPPCPHLPAFPMVAPTITRDSDLLCCPDGRIYSPRALNQLLKSASSFRFCQFVHERSGQLLVRAVSNNRRALEDLAHVRAEVQRVLGNSMQVRAELAANPIVRAGGKIPLIVQQAGVVSPQVTQAEIS